MRENVHSVADEGYDVEHAKHRMNSGESLTSALEGQAPPVCSELDRPLELDPKNSNFPPLRLGTRTAFGAIVWTGGERYYLLHDRHGAWHQAHQAFVVERRA